ncbi:putative intraflagellar transport protein 20 [Monocercomonoides exilis]|uniref:putative intraflagellar transport protein 20 n=1 Tax=Monocercomonoides exilis TaxID=2049356 RepID=UPI0035598837|nr:putative intraflagellar transport protein 20 [Monocercomonoides exilis]|eukprot:MONOS_7473.1-p1 / transcript=MONOS_7473.1 / gene=MONOS_7473 / organism=Monocercomonoides_exilis_PA203 / gene_product=unspecified product / transcript_product=unspecified product / location=Mono_scaffold00256:21348-21854(+) / protein_length=133 / sequence_SO=supercontig / SO=protein_coding / is_pseudo=false
MENDLFDVDELGQLHVMPAKKADQSKNLVNQTQTFSTKIDKFAETVFGYVEYVDKMAQQTEQEKTKAMGFRNILASESEYRTRRKFELEALLMDRNTELQRLKAELDSLIKLEAEQQQMIQALAAMEPLPTGQ